MTSLVKIAQSPLARVLIVGFPGAGKTGALAALANAGYKIHLASFGANLEPLIRFVKPENYGNVEVEQFADAMKGGNRMVELKAEATAFRGFTQKLDKWTTEDAEGQVIDRGSINTWGPQDILVLDDLTGMGDAARRRTLFVNNRNPLTSRRQDWGAAAADQDAIIARIAADAKCHFICLSHLKLIGPDEGNEDDADWQKEIKEARAQEMRTRWYPTALGRQLPQFIHRHFGTMLLAEAKMKGGKVVRVLRTVPTEALDIKVPATDVPDELPIDTGLLTVFNAITKSGG